ncbi:MAG: NRAMP (natural resistance-associated macrophage protein)-like metal ion transporter [Alphaproteobacteria bacterium]|jgi:NRAMP (natural resistance-associated macrophage protein)-like metal ion transporter
MRAGVKGLIIAAAFIGPGTVTTATLVGAQTGYALVWLLIFAILATFILQEMASRLGTITGVGLSEAIMLSITNPILKWLIAGLVIVAIGVGNAAYEGGNITGAALGLSANFGGSIKHWALLLGILALLLLVSGQYKLLEKFLIGLVATMSLVFITLMVLVGIDTSLLTKGLLMQAPMLSNTALALAIIGTTIVPYNLFLHAGLSAQDTQNKTDNKAISKKEMKHQNGQLFASIGVGGLVTFAILSSSVSAFFVAQIAVNPSNIANQLTPLLGQQASLFFGIGLFAAGLTSAITAPLAAAYAISGLFGWQPSLQNMKFKLTAILIVAVGTTMASIGLKPIALILIAQTANALLLPISAILLVWVCNRKALLGEYKNGVFANTGAGVVIILVLGLAFYKLFV